MNSKERMLCAIGLGKPDRLPVTVHQWQTYHLTHQMGGMSPLFRRLSEINRSRRCPPLFHMHAVSWLDPYRPESVA